MCIYIPNCDTVCAPLFRIWDSRYFCYCCCYSVVSVWVRLFFFMVLLGIIHSRISNCNCNGLVYSLHMHLANVRYSYMKRIVRIRISHISYSTIPCVYVMYVYNIHYKRVILLSSSLGVSRWLFFFFAAKWRRISLNIQIKEAEKSLRTTNTIIFLAMDNKTVD